MLKEIIRGLDTTICNHIKIVTDDEIVVVDDKLTDIIGSDKLNRYEFVNLTKITHDNDSWLIKPVVDLDKTDFVSIRTIPATENRLEYTEYIGRPDNHGGCGYWIQYGDTVYMLSDFKDRQVQQHKNATVARLVPAYFHMYASINDDTSKIIHHISRISLIDIIQPDNTDRYYREIYSVMLDSICAKVIDELKFHRSVVHVVTRYLVARRCQIMNLYDFLNVYTATVFDLREIISWLARPLRNLRYKDHWLLAYNDSSNNLNIDEQPVNAISDTAMYTLNQQFTDPTIKANYDELILNLIDRYGCDIIPADQFCPSFIENELAKDGISE